MFLGGVMKKPELLAPAGNLESLKAAILAGCDAVYLGGKFFGARNFATNFNDEEIIYAINYAHIYGVKVYVTMNTLVYENEMVAFEKYALFLHKNNVDAIIIQDIGAMDLLRQKYPSLPLHASTQMHIHNLEGVKLVESLGLERVVLARETPIELIKKIKENTNIELEIFVHGALCISYSGECLMSSLLNGRSGNRGTCSQCCRMPYDLYINDKKVSKEKYLLSPKDLNSLDHLEELLKIGVDSLKIEGRMKRKEYVYTVVKLYRKAIDSYYETGHIKIDENDIYELKKIFNRDFTKGFLNHEKSENFINSVRPNHIGIEIGEVIDVNKNMVTVKLTHPLNQNDGIRIIGKSDTGCMINKLYYNKKLTSHVEKGKICSFLLKEKVNVHDKVLLTTDSIQLNTIEHILKTEKKQIKIKGKAVCKDNVLTFTITDNKNIVEVSTKDVENALKISTSKERVAAQLKKTGDTSFIFDGLDVEIEDNVFIRIDVINHLRVSALDKLKEKRMYKTEVVYGNYEVDIKNKKQESGRVAYIKNINDYSEEYMEYITDDEEIYDKLKDKTTIYYKLPRVLESIPNVDKNLMVGELGSLYKYKNVITDFSFNVVNSYSVALLHKLGAKRVTLSYELNDYQVKKIVEAYKKRYQASPSLERIVSSTPEVMVLKYDMLKPYHVKSAILKDYQNHSYKVEKNNFVTTIYHFDKLELENALNNFNLGVEKIRYHLF
jgi:putative protease